MAVRSTLTPYQVWGETLGNQYLRQQDSTATVIVSSYHSHNPGSWWPQEEQDNCFLYVSRDKCEGPTLATSHFVMVANLCS